MKSAPLQTAIYTKLSGDATLVALLSTAWGSTAIFSHTPETGEDESPAYYPFISFGQDVHSPFNDKSVVGGDTTLEINVWSQQGDFMEAKTIADRIAEILERQSLTVAGANHITTELESADATRDPDGITKRVLMTFTVLYQTE